MDNKIEGYKTVSGIEENNSLIEYNNLLNRYEDSRQASEKILKEYENLYSNTDPIKCSCIVAYNLKAAIIKWQITTLDGNAFYNSNNSLQYDTCKIDLNSLNVQVGVLFRLRLVFDINNDKYSEEIFQYEPDSATMYYEYDNSLHFNGLVPSVGDPPVIKCSSIAAKHTKYPVIMAWELINVANGKVLDGSSRCKLGDTWTYSLSNFGLPAGSKFKLRANVKAGDNSEAYLYLEYDPTSSDRAYFGFYGNAFKTIVPYKG